jgi:hypothetical protein
MLDSIFDLPSRTEFAADLMRELRAAGDPRVSRFDPELFQIDFFEGERHVGVASLSNLYEEFVRRGSAERRRFMKQSVRALLSTHKKVPVDFEDVRPDLLLAVRDRAYFALTETKTRLSVDPDFTWPHWPLAEHLAIGLVYDLPESMLMIQQRQLDEWDISFYEAYEIGRGNLMEIDATFAAMGDSLYVAETHDNYDAARLLMVEWIQELPVRGQTVAMVPNRDRLLITGSEDTRGMVNMVQLAHDALSQPRSMSGFTFVLEGDDCVPWLPDPEDECYAPLLAMRTQSLRQDYAQQTCLLEQIRRSAGQTMSIPSLLVGKNRRSGQLITYCQWLEGRGSLLPRADYVVLVPESKNPGSTVVPVCARWESLEDALGDMTPMEDLYPVRYQVGEFPHGGQLGRLHCGDELELYPYETNPDAGG